ncbi:nuclear transport factor 2 family protein [Frankia gtarii]|uniref:nuclear transport factor 2 family protein n=1 Tax=Frankia gtarii TaxID=2950102 RepID=UPI0021BF41D3|nr:nuclear transport factor 2 family protein [Frankia gtarii]
MTVAQPADLAGLGRAEDLLQSVVAANDAVGLAGVLHDDLVARGHDGLLHGKAEDVAGYASGAFAVTSYAEPRRHCLLHGATGVTFVRAAITARINSVLAEVDAAAVRAGISRVEYLRRTLAAEAEWASRGAHTPLVREDWAQLGELISDIAGEDVMRGAWS